MRKLRGSELFFRGDCLRRFDLTLLQQVRRQDRRAAPPALQLGPSGICEENGTVAEKWQARCCRRFSAAASRLRAFAASQPCNSAAYAQSTWIARYSCESSETICGLSRGRQRTAVLGAVTCGRRRPRFSFSRCDRESIDESTGLRRVCFGQRPCTGVRGHEVEALRGRDPPLIEEVLQRLQIGGDEERGNASAVGKALGIRRPVLADAEAGGFSLFEQTSK